MIQLSVVILTKNEELNIARTLNPLAEIADEIIVMDSGSTDKTREICESFVKSHSTIVNTDSWLTFIETPWLGFGPTKNAGIIRSKFNFILSLDADEVLSNEIIDEIKLLKNTLNPDSDTSFAFNRLTKYGSHWIYHSGWYPDWHTRIFSKKKFKWNDSAVHEMLVPINHNSEGQSSDGLNSKSASESASESKSNQTKLIQLKGEVYHYSYKGIKDHIQKLTRYAQLGATQVQTKPWPILLFKMVFNPPFRFIRVYLLNGGLLDGWIGLIISGLTSYGVFLKYYFALKNLSSKS